jgi:hypothetical protein
MRITRIVARAYRAAAGRQTFIVVVEELAKDADEPEIT